MQNLATTADTTKPLNKSQKEMGVMRSNAVKGLVEFNKTINGCICWLFKDPPWCLKLISWELTMLKRLPTSASHNF